MNKLGLIKRVELSLIKVVGGSELHFTTFKIHTHEKRRY